MPDFTDPALVSLAEELAELESEVFEISEYADPTEFLNAATTACSSCNSCGLPK